LNIRPAAIAIELASAPVAFTQVAKSTLAAGVGWVELSSGASSVDVLRADFPGHLFATVSVDEQAVGELHASQCQALLPKGGEVLYVEGPTANTSVKARRQAFEMGLRNTSISIGKTIAADWTEEGAEKATLTWLRQASAYRAQPSLICSQNDAMAIGVLKAARSQYAHWAGVPAIGCDGVSNVGQRYVREGTLKATVVKPVTAGPAADWIIRRIRGEKPARHLILRPTSFPTLPELTRRT
jgi:ABC-type sugar transport system substrate-binding protein